MRVRLRSLTAPVTIITPARALRHSTPRDEIPILPQEFGTIVHPVTTSGTKRVATMIAAVLVLFVTAMPGATVCCFEKPGIPIAAMHASMPCCTEQCTMSSPNSGREHDATLTPAPAPPVVTATAALIPSTPTANATPPVPAMDQAAHAYAAPPPFLINSQFRI